MLHLERTHAAGCRFASLLTTRDREQFVSLSNEVLVADDLLRRGYSVRTVPQANDPSPDLHVLGDAVDIAVEVYSPCAFLAFDAWDKALSDLFQYVDVPANYHSSAGTAYEQTIPPNPSQRQDPWAIAEMLAQTREQSVRDARASELGRDDLAPAERPYANPFYWAAFTYAGA